MYDKIEALPVKGVKLEGSLLEQIAQKDFMIYTPFQTFSYVINF